MQGASPGGAARVHLRRRSDRCRLPFTHADPDADAVVVLDLDAAAVDYLCAVSDGWCFCGGSADMHLYPDEHIEQLLVADVRIG